MLELAVPKKNQRKIPNPVDVLDCCIERAVIGSRRSGIFRG